MPLDYLLVPTRGTRNIDLFLEVCFWSGIQVTQIGPDTEHHPVEGCTLMNSTIHGGPGFCRRVARTLGATVSEPADDFLVRLPPEYANRKIGLTKLEQARSLAKAKFIKPVNDKHFPAGVYASGADLPVDAALSEEWVLVSDPVDWECEYRMFVRDYQVRASSAYDPSYSRPTVSDQDEPARAFCERVLLDKRVRLPRAVVLDVGLIKGNGWAVVEANAAVMSGIYDCDPIAVLGVLEYGLEQLPEAPIMQRRTF